VRKNKTPWESYEKKTPWESKSRGQGKKAPKASYRKTFFSGYIERWELQIRHVLAASLPCADRPIAAGME